MVHNNLELLYQAITTLAAVTQLHKQVTDAALVDAKKAVRKGAALKLDARVTRKNGRQWLVIEIAHDSDLIRRHLAQNAERVLGIQHISPTYCIVSGSTVTIEGALSP